MAAFKERRRDGKTKIMPSVNSGGMISIRPAWRDYLFFAARIFAQRALAAAPILARPAALMVCFFLAGLSAAWIFAQRALAAAAIFARPAALIVHFFFGGLPTWAAEPLARASSLAESFSICCFSEMIRFSLAVDMFNSPVIDLKTTQDYLISLVSKCGNNNSHGGGCNPVTGGAGDAGGKTSYPGPNCRRKQSEYDRLNTSTGSSTTVPM